MLGSDNRVQKMFFSKRVVQVTGMICMILLSRYTGAEDVCVPFSVDQEFHDSDLVFSARILHLEMNDGEMRADAEVLRIWKGKLDTRIQIIRKKEDVPCAIPFQVDGVYLVYAEGTKQPFIRCCSTILSIEEASKDIARIEEIRREEAGRQSGPRDPFVEMKGDRSNRKGGSAPTTLNITYAVVVGIAKQGEEFTALIRAMNGKVYTMKAGDLLSDGEILQILSNRVIFLQRTRSGKKRVEKKLHPFPQ